MPLSFVKMHGLGNDFVLIDDLKSNYPTALTTDVVKLLCDRRFGVGCDQLLWLLPPHDKGASARMEIRDADGSVAEMCGNGIRAAALYLFKSGPVPGLSRYSIETLAGLKTVERAGETHWKVNMGVPRLGAGVETGGEDIDVDGLPMNFFEVDMGNPHAVFFVEKLAGYPVTDLGPRIENHKRFPHRTNVEFIEITGPQDISVGVWERGAGLTMACGTGACAVAVAAQIAAKMQGPLKIKFPGGTLLIEWAGKGSPVFMTGPAEEVFRGTY